MKMLTYVPTLDMNMLRNGDFGRFAAAFGEALEGIGFVVLVNHGIPSDLLDSAYDVARQIFRYPDKVLTKYETPENGRTTGFASFGVEHAKTSKKGDLKRFWHVRDEDAPGVVPNRWPSEVPVFRSTMLGLFEELYKLAQALEPPPDSYLGLRPGTLGEMLGRPETLLRILHYPPIQGKPEGVRSHPHEDINLYTLLVAASESGLQVKARDGRWVPVNEQPGSIVVNVGDMLQEFTNGRLRSPTHRVVNSPRGTENERFSAPFFVHARSEAVLNSETRLTAGAYLTQRLREIGLLSY